MILYHGTNADFERINLTIGLRYKDFGWGFYLTPDRSIYITPTDVATFLLYGHDLYGMNTFSVYSTALCCYFTYNATAHSIVLVEDEESMRQ